MSTSGIMLVYFEECEEQLAELERGLLAIESGEGDAETVNAVFRAVHSIKGGAGAFGLEQLVRFAHVFETTLDGVRAGRLDASAQLIRTMLRSADALTDLVHRARDGGAVDQNRITQLTGELESYNAADTSGGLEEKIEFQPIAFDLASLIGDLAAEPVDPLKTFKITFKPKPELYAKANETAILLREVARLGTVETTCDASELPNLDVLDPQGACLTWAIRLTTDKDEAAIREIFEFAEWDSDLDVAEEDGAAPSAALIEALTAVAVAPMPDEPADIVPAIAPAPVEAKAPVDAAAKADAGRGDQGGHGAPAQQATIRVEIERIDRLMDLVGELVINQSMLMQRVAEAGLPRS